MVADTVPVELVNELRRMLEEQRAELDRIKAERENESRVVNGDYEDSLQRAVREFREQNEKDLGGVQAGLCLQCGKTWKDTDGEIRAEHLLAGMRPGAHSFRSYEIPEPSVKAAYSRNPDEKRVEPEDPSEFYMSEKDAALTLGVTAAQVRSMLKAGILRADKFGKTSLVRRATVKKVIADVEAAQEAGIPDGE